MITKQGLSIRTVCHQLPGIASGESTFGCRIGVQPLMDGAFHNSIVFLHLLEHDAHIFARLLTLFLQHKLAEGKLAALCQFGKLF